MSKSTEGTKDKNKITPKIYNCAMFFENKNFI